MGNDSFLIFAFLLFLVGVAGHYLIVNSNKNEVKSHREIELEEEVKRLTIQGCVNRDTLNSVLHSRDLFYKEQEESTKLYEFLISLLVAEWGATRLSGLRDNDKMGIMIQTPSGRLFAISRQHELYADLPIDKSWTWELVLSKQGVGTQDQIHQDLKLYANFAIQTKIAEERSFSTQKPNSSPIPNSV